MGQKTLTVRDAPGDPDLVPRLLSAAEINAIDVMWWMHSLPC